MSTLTNAPDLTKQPPRSARARLGGYVLLPRMLDKGRATLAGTNGAYHYACPLDQQWIGFAGIDADKLKEQIALGKGDGELLEWITENSTTKRQPWEIAQWSAYMEARGPGDVETKEFFTTEVAKLTTTREDILTWSDWLDLDDYVSFGGKA
jgi:hypothetical protein